MAGIKVTNVSLDYPVYGEGGGARSIKKTLLRSTRGSNIAEDSRHRITVHALQKVSFEIADGQRVGILGANGAGKTTLLKVLCGIYEPTAGTIETTGKVQGLLSASLGLNRDETGRDNILLRGIYLDIRPREMREKIDEIIAFSELGDYIDMPVYTYSAGMTVRLAFAISTCLEPEILIMDEWLGAGDAAFIEKAQRRMESFVSKTRVLILASHSMGLLEKWCDTGILLKQGQLVATGPIKEVTARYREDVSAQTAVTAGASVEERLPALATWREYNQRGVQLVSEKRFPEALSDFDEAIRLAPPTAVLHQRRGTIRMASKDILGAMEDFESALRLEPQSAVLKDLATEAHRRYESAGLSLTN